MARIDGWEPKRAPKQRKPVKPRKWGELILALLIIAMFMGAAIADWTRQWQIPAPHKHHPHTVTWLVPDGGAQ